MALVCTECGRPAKNITQVYCDCGGYVEFETRRPKPVIQNQTKKESGK